MDIQEQWDRKILDLWFNYKNAFMYVTAKIFVEHHNLSDDEFAALKRTPAGDYYLNHMTVTRFVAVALPRLNNVIWDAKPGDVERLLRVMRKCTNTERSMSAKENAEMRERSKTRSDFNRALEVRQAIGKRLDSHRRSSQWGVCK